MNDEQIIEWIAEHLGRLRITPYGNVEIVYIDDAGYEQSYMENNEGNEPSATLLKRAVANVNGLL